jgi:hypothetical protein
MRAGMEVAVRLRRAGLEPGRIARLTVVAGDVSGLLPADGDLGEGDQVALLETRSLLLGIARCSRYVGVDNPRLWTTADVRAALEALGLQGRGPSVEELNGEGFPYSPYKLRLPQLLAPAAMAATANAPAAAMVGGLPEEEPARSPIARAVAAQAAAAAAAAQPAAPAEPAPAAPGSAPAVSDVRTVSPEPVKRPRDTVAIDAPAPAAGGVAAPVAPAPHVPEATPAMPPLTADAPPRTAVFAQPATPAAPPWTPAGAGEADDADDADDSDDSDATGPGRRTAVLLALAGLLVVVLLGVGGWLLLGGGDDGSGAGDAADAPDEVAPGPQPGDVQAVDGTSFTAQVSQVADSCAAHAYGEVAAFFAATDCTGLSRALWSTEVEGAPVVVSVVRVRMADTATARELQALADRNGSGNVSDLLREGVSYPGGPDRLSGAEYASAVSGPTVTIVEAAWVDPAAGGASDVVDRVASNGLALATPPLPEG